MNNPTTKQEINYELLKDKFEHCLNFLGDIQEKETSQGIVRIGGSISFGDNFVPYQIIISDKEIIYI